MLLWPSVTSGPIRDSAVPNTWYEESLSGTWRNSQMCFLREMEFTNPAFRATEVTFSGLDGGDDIHAE